MENWKAITFLLASGQGIILSLALLSPAKNKDCANIFLGLILWVISLELLNAWGMQVNYFASASALPFYLLGSYLILPPAAWLFIRLSTEPGFQLRKKHLFLFLPALVETLVEIGMHLRFRYTGHFTNMLDNSTWYFLTEIVPIAGMVLVLFLYGKRFFDLSKKSNVSNTPKAALHLLKLYSLFTFLSLFTVLWIAGVIIDLPIFGYMELILAVFLFTLGYIGYFRPGIFEGPKFSPPKAPDTNAFPNYEDEKELNRLNTLLKEDALFTRSKLSLEELAEKLKLPPRYLSYLINRYHATNFHHFINAFRVAEVIRKIKDPAEQHKTLLALALEAGFSSKSTFNHVFKKHTGQAPSQYLLCHK